MGRWIDISMGITDGLRTNFSKPGEEVRITYDVKFEAEKKTVRRISTRLHSGTHIDGPEHMVMDGKRIDQYPLEAFVGRAWVVDMYRKVPKGIITAGDIDKEIGDKVEKGDIIIVRTGWNSYYSAPNFFADSPAFDPAAAGWCIERGLKMVVIDCLAGTKVKELQVPGPGFKALLLAGGILIMTNADGLNQIKKKQVTLYAFPLKIVPSESGLTRAVVWEE